MPSVAFCGGPEPPCPRTEGGPDFLMPCRSGSVGDVNLHLFYNMFPYGILAGKRFVVVKVVGSSYLGLVFVMFSGSKGS